MKRWARPLVYLLVVTLAVMAYLAPPESEDDLLATRIRPDRTDARRVERGRPHGDGFIAIAPRLSKPMAKDLFPAEAAVQPTVAVEAPDVALSPPPMPDLKILGWMELESVPHVFIELSGESHTLIPGATAADLYRFEKMGAGVAVFSYLPDGRLREFAVSDPALSE